MRSSPRILGEFAVYLYREGLRALPAYWSAIDDGLSQRRVVSRILRCDRRDVELRWIAKPGQS
jgi:hypothetical protein